MDLEQLLNDARRVAEVLLEFDRSVVIRSEAVIAKCNYTVIGIAATYGLCIYISFYIVEIMLYIRYLL